MPTPLTIGRLAGASDVHVETVRYYHRRGLLEEPAKPLRGVRHYPVEAIRRIRFIKRAQQLGFSLTEIEDLLRLNDGQSCDQTRALAERKLSVIAERMADLTRMKKLLKGLVAQCVAGNQPHACPIISALSTSGA